MKVKSLAYVGIQTKKLEAWDNFATDVLGLMRSDSSEKFLKFKVDERSFRIAIHTGKEEKLNYVGFELKNKSEFEEAKKELKELKINFKVANTEDCVFKDVKEMIQFSDPIGTQIDLFYGRTLDYQKFISSNLLINLITHEHFIKNVAKDAEIIEEFDESFIQDYFMIKKNI